MSSTDLEWIWLDGAAWNLSRPRCVVVLNGKGFTQTALLRGNEVSNAERLRIFFFSDWRIQPLTLAENLIRSVSPVDLIVYGGDDVVRFVAMPDMPDQHNWLSKISSYARYGVIAIIGNDCQPCHRAILDAPGVRDIHASPVALGGWGFVGVEGALYRDAKNRIGYILHPDREAKQQAMRALKTLSVSPKQLVIVSHTPPAGCGLDYALRFGFDKIGSKTLQDFVLKHHPALVLSGHCHCRGGKHTHLGTTLVVNGASDDTSIQRARACLIELDPDEPPDITWLDPIPLTVTSVPDVGVKRAEILQSYGVTTPEQLFSATAEVLAAIQFGPVRTARLQAYARAVTENIAIWLKKPVLPEKMLFYDVETGLNIGGAFSLENQQEPWMIAISDGKELQQWVVPDEDHTARKAMYRELLEYTRNYPDSTLCSYSGSNFDNRSIEAGLRRWYNHSLEAWHALPKLDLLCLLKECLALPTRSWGLKDVARWCGYTFTNSNLDGFEVGLLYEGYRRFGESLPVEDIARYNIEDVNALACVAEWVRMHLPV